jgi:hypothetical protein
MDNNENSILTEGDKARKNKPNASKWATASSVMAGLGVLLLPLFPLFALLAIIFGVIALVRIRRAEGGLGGMKRAVFGIVFPLVFGVFLGGVFYVWSIDAPPVPNEWTIEDLRSAEPEYNVTWEILNELNKKSFELKDGGGNCSKDAENISVYSKVFSGKDYSEMRQAVKDNAERIEQLWADAEEARHIINRLSEYEQIASLTEPDLKFFCRFLSPLRQVYLRHIMHSILLVEQGKENQAVDEILKYNDVIKKYSLNSRSLLEMFLCDAILAQEFKLASYICCCGNVSNEQIKRLENQVLKNIDDVIDLKNSFTFEYLFFKEHMDVYGKLAGLKTQFNKANSTKRFYMNNISSYFDEKGGVENKLLDVWPDSYPDILKCEISFPISDLDKLPRRYYLYNPIGSMLVSMLQPTFEKIVEMHDRLKDDHQVLGVVFALRLGDGEAFRKYSRGIEYTVDIDDMVIYAGTEQGDVAACKTGCCGGRGAKRKFFLNPDVMDMSLLEITKEELVSRDK